MNKNEKKLNFIFIIIFLIILYLPMIFFNRSDSVASGEKRKLASFPNSFNSNIFKEIDAYLKDRFGLREKLIELDSNLKYKLLDDSGNERVILGKDNWLFYRQEGNYEDYLKVNLVKKDYANRFAEEIKEKQEWCNQNGIAFIFMICPNKHTVYPEKYPLKRPDGITRTEQLIKVMEEKGVNYLYPYSKLLENKSKYSLPLYYKLDTHWNNLGTYIAFLELYKKVKSSLEWPTLLSEIEYSFTVADSTGGDLSLMLGLNNEVETKLDFNPKDGNWLKYHKCIEKSGPSLPFYKTVITENTNKDLPSALIFRDSFFTLLSPFTSSIFSKVNYQGGLFKDDYKTKILKDKPDIVIWEVVERNLYLILR